jgi:acetate kinase
VSRRLPIPRRYDAAGVRRFGFHGLSYAYLIEELARLAGPRAVIGNVVLAHLGAGASMAAVKNGKSIDTTMAFTPTAGLMMATRPGDIDGGLLVHLMRIENMTWQRMDDLLNRECGLLGVSETSADMRDLIAHRDTDPRAAEAVDLFCYTARKWLGALAAALGGVDTVVFAGGIGEHSPLARAGICAGLEFSGIKLDATANDAGAAIISTADSPATIRIIKTDEEVMIARIVMTLLAGQ